MNGWPRFFRPTFIVPVQLRVCGYASLSKKMPPKLPRLHDHGRITIENWLLGIVLEKWAKSCPKKSKFSPTIFIAAHVATHSSCNGVWDVNIRRVGDSRHRRYSNRYEEIHVAKDTKNRPLPRLQHVDASSYLILVIFQWQPFSNPLEHGVFVSSARFVSLFNAIPLTCIPNYMSTQYVSGLTSTRKFISANSAKQRCSGWPWRNILRKKPTQTSRLLRHFRPVRYVVSKERVLRVIRAF